MKHLEEMRILRDKSDEDLEEELNHTRQDMFKFRTELATRTLADVKAVRTARKKVARILTLARERELEAQGGTVVEGRSK